MLEILILIGVIINTALLAVPLQRSTSKPDVIELTHLIRPGAAKGFVENVEKVKKGNSKDEVEDLLGKADSLTDEEWLYNLDEHSGYVISFDGGFRVEAVNLWFS